mgnify:CR=1 FL=1
MQVVWEPRGLAVRHLNAGELSDAGAIALAEALPKAGRAAVASSSATP